MPQQDRSRMPARALRRGAVVLTGAAALSVLGFSGSAQAADHNWDGVAQCESSGNWNSNTGNGYYGGLQFSASTWAAYGGRQYAPNAHQASKAQQIEIAERTLDGQGVGAWPVCGRHLTGAATSTSTAAAAPERASRAERAAPASSGTHVVRSGDTLGAIAARYGTAGGWQAVAAANRNQISNPDLIRVGQVLQLP